MCSPNAADRALIMSMDSTFCGLDYETVTYYPRSGGSRSISAVLEFPGAELIGDLTGGRRPVVDVYVKNNSSSGISSAEVNTGGDKIKVPQRYGLTANTIKIIEIAGQEKALLHLRCQ